MSDQDRMILERLKQGLSERLSLYRVILFGSRARGDADADSDMDVLVVLHGPVNPQFFTPGDRRRAGRSRNMKPEHVESQ